MPTVQDRRSGPLTKCSVCGALGSNSRGLIDPDSRGLIDLQCVPDSCPYIDRMLKPRVERHLEGADPHGDVVAEQQRAEADEDAAFLAAHQPIIVGRIEYRDTQSGTDARTLAAYAVNLARGHDLAAFEAGNLAAIALRYGCRGARDAHPDETDVGPLLEELLAGADRRHADRVAASLWRNRSHGTPVRTRPRLARLWAFLAGCAS